MESFSVNCLLKEFFFSKKLSRLLVAGMGFNKLRKWILNASCVLFAHSLSLSVFFMFSRASEYISVLYIHLSCTRPMGSSVFSLVDEGWLWHTAWGNPACPLPQVVSCLSQHFTPRFLLSLWTQIQVPLCRTHWGWFDSYPFLSLTQYRSVFKVVTTSHGVI